MKLGLAFLLVAALPLRALAQDDPSGTPEPGSGGSGMIATDGTRSIGVGVEQTLGGIGSATFVYDAGRWHIDALLGFRTVDVGADDYREISLAGRFFFTIHRAERADFSIGGGIGLINTDLADEGGTAIHLEGAAKIRAFLVPNVALSASLGLLIVASDDEDLIDDADTISLGNAQLGGAFGLTYFF